MSDERSVLEHYRHGALEDALLKGLAAAGKDIGKLTPDDLAPADEFHIGGRQATVDFAAEFKPAAETHWLDIGSGLAISRVPIGAASPASTSVRNMSRCPAR